MLDFKTFNRFPSLPDDQKQWKKVQIGSFYFPSNDRAEAKDMRKWLDEMESKAEKEGLQAAHLDTVQNEDEFGHVTSISVVFVGYRLENNSEFRQRITHLLNHEQNRKHQWELQKNYFDTKEDLLGTPYEQRVAKLNDALDSLVKKAPAKK